MTKFNFKSNQIFSDAAASSANVPGEVQLVRYIPNKTVVELQKAQKPHSINVLEIWGIYRAAKFAKKNNIQNAEIYTDNFPAYTWIKKGKSNITQQTELREYELFVQKTGEIKEVKFGNYYEIDEYRKSKGLGIRKKKDGRVEKINITNIDEETKLADDAIKYIKESGAKVFLWDTDAHGQIPADFGRKAA